MLRSVLVGYGHAGQNLHHRSLRTLGLAEEVLVVDPVCPERLPQGARWLPNLSSALAALPDANTGVFHVLTPVHQHLSVTRDLITAGARRVILEKPITATFDEAMELSQLTGRAQIAPVSVWPASRITERVRELLVAGRIGELSELHFEQSKPRFRRSILESGHHNAFEVELPHQVLLALHLAGAVDEVVAARAWDSPLASPLGGADMVLRHTNGVTSTLVSDLTSPVRIRRLRLTGTSGEIIADYPIGSEDDFGQVRVAGEDREVLVDAPLTQFIDRTYAHAAGVGPPPPAPLTDHVNVIALLDQAEAMTSSRRNVLC